jgi:cytochrome P450
MVFNPGRFVKTETNEPAPDPHNYVFGFGRRVCPGKLLADNALYLNVAQTLAAFNISPVLEEGKAAEPQVRFEPGVVSHPAPFKSDIKPRSAHHEQLVKDVLKTYPWRESDGKVLENINF